MITDNLSPEETRIYELLKEVMDPEVAVNVVDLGLVYEIHYEKDKDIHVVVTLSTRGCPLGDTILNNIKVVLQQAYPGHEVNVDLKWEPEWNPGMITEEGKNGIDGS